MDYVPKEIVKRKTASKKKSKKRKHNRPKTEIDETELLVEEKRKELEAFKDHLEDNTVKELLREKDDPEYAKKRERQRRRGKKKKKKKRKLQISQKDFQRHVIDNILENFHMETMVLRRKEEFGKMEGNIELQRLTAALRFLVDDIGIRERLIKEMNLDEDEIQLDKHVANGSLLAATSWHSTLQIGAAREEDQIQVVSEMPSSLEMAPLTPLNEDNDVGNRYEYQQEPLGEEAGEEEAGEAGGEEPLDLAEAPPALVALELELKEKAEKEDHDVEDMMLPRAHQAQDRKFNADLSSDESDEPNFDRSPIKAVVRRKRAERGRATNISMAAEAWRAQIEDEEEDDERVKGLDAGGVMADVPADLGNGDSPVRGLDESDDDEDFLVGRRPGAGNNAAPVPSSSRQILLDAPGLDPGRSFQDAPVPHIKGHLFADMMKKNNRKRGASIGRMLPHMEDEEAHSSRGHSRRSSNVSNASEQDDDEPVRKVVRRKAKHKAGEAPEFPDPEKMLPPGMKKSRKKKRQQEEAPVDNGAVKFNEKVQFDDEPEEEYQGVFGDDYFKYVTGELGDALLERFNQVWEDCGLDYDAPIVTPFEAHMYSMLCEYLFERCEATEQEIEDHPHYWLLQDIISSLRQIELTPTSFHRGGFLYKIDNILAILLYRRKSKAARKAESMIENTEALVKQQAAQSKKETKEYVAHLSNMCNWGRKRSAAMMGIVVTLLIATGVFIIYTTWSVTALKLTEDGLRFLSIDNAERARAIIAGFTGSALIADSLNQGNVELIRTSLNNVITGLHNNVTYNNDPTADLDIFLADTARAYSVKSAFVASSDGHFIAATRMGVLEPGFVDISKKVIHIEATNVTNGIADGCLLQYKLLRSEPSTGPRAENPFQTLACGFDARSRPWYKRALNSPDAGVWTDAYNFVNTDSTSNTLGITYAKAIRNTTGHVVAVFGVDIMFVDINAQLATIGVNGEGVIFVTDRFWNVIASSPNQVDIDYRYATMSNVTAGTASNELLHTSANLLRALFPLPTEIGVLSPSVQAIIDRSPNDPNAAQYWFAEEDNTYIFMAQVFSPQSVLVTSSAVSNYSLIDPRFKQWMVAVSVDSEETKSDINFRALQTAFLGLICMFLSVAIAYFSFVMVVEHKSSKEAMLEKEAGMKKDKGGPEKGSPVKAITSPGHNRVRSMSKAALLKQQEEKTKSKEAATAKDMHARVIKQTAKADKARKRNKKMLTACILGLVTLFLLIWVNWQTNTSSDYKEITDQLESEAAERVFQDVFDYMETPPQLLQTIRDKFVRDGFAVSGTSNETWDRYFYHVMASHAQPGSRFLVDYAYWADESGRFGGVQVYDTTTVKDSGINYGLDYNGTFSDRLYTTYNLGNGSFVTNYTNITSLRNPPFNSKALRFGAKDALSPCYSLYGAKPATDVGDGLHALVRDLDRVQFVSPGCQFDPRTTSWYTAAKAKGTDDVVWSNVYQFESTQELGITISRPLFQYIYNESVQVTNTSSSAITNFSVPVNCSASTVETLQTLCNITALNVTTVNNVTYYTKNVTTFTVTITRTPVTTKVFQGVAGIDISLANLNNYLAAVKAGDTSTITATDAKESKKANAATFLLDRTTGQLVASSSGTDQDTFKTDGVFTATQSADETTAGTAVFLENSPGGFSVLTERIKLQRPLESPLTTVDTLTACCKNLDWVVVVDMPFDEFLGEFEDSLLVSFLICIGVVFIVLYLVLVSITAFRSTAIKKDSFKLDKHTTLLEEMSSESVNKKVLNKLMEVIRPDVVDACAHTWRRRLNDKENKYAPVRFEEIREHYYRTAIEHINNARENRNIISICYLQSRHQDLETEYDAQDDSQFYYNFYAWVTSRSYLLVLHGAIVLHIALAFLEPATFEEMKKEGIGRFLTPAEAACLAVEWIDILNNYIIMYSWKTRNFLDSKTDKAVDICYALVVFLVTIDYVLTVTVPISFEYLFPLRPFIIVLRNKEIRDAAVGFCVTVFYARNVFLLFLCILLAAAAMGTVLFRNALNTSGPQSSYKNFIRSITTTVVYISTGENYGEVVYPTYAISPWYILYFILFILIGMFFVLAMVIGMFQDGFQQRRQQKARETQLYQRVGTVAAFILMDLDGSETLTTDEFQDFLLTLRPQINPDVIKSLFRKTNKNKDSSLDVAEFVNGIEDIIYHKLVLRRETVKVAKWRTALRVLIFESKWYQKIMLLIVLSNVWIISMYGTTDQEKTLDKMCACLLFLYFVELSLKALAYGWDEFWNYAAYNEQKDEDEDEDDRELDDEDDDDEFGYDEHKVIEDASRSRFGFVKVRAKLLVKRDDDDEFLPSESLKERMRRKNTGDMESLGLPKEIMMVLEQAMHERKDRERLERNAENIHQMYANRFEFILVYCSFAAWCATRLWRGRIDYDEDEDQLRFVLTFPLLRLFSVIKRTRSLVFTLMKLLPDFASVLAVLFVVFFLYGVTGVWLFEGEWDILQDDKPDCGFEDLSQAMICLFQLLVGEAWHEVMYAAIRASRGFGVSWYFVSYTFVVTLLFVNVFIGIVLHNFQQIFLAAREKRKAQKLKQRERAKKEAAQSLGLDNAEN